MPSSKTATRPSAPPAKTGLPSLLSVGLLCAIVALITLRPLSTGIPVGWDIFYHLRVARLAQDSGNLLNYDPVSAGGRYHTYVPGNTALLLSVSLLTGRSVRELSMWTPLLFSTLAILSFWLLVRHQPWGMVSTGVFAFTIETLEFFISSGMPQQPALFLLLTLFTMRSLNPLFSLAIGITHPSTLVLLSVFEILRIGSESIASILRRLSIAILGGLPYLAWAIGVGMSVTAPTWGWPVSLKYFLQQLDYRVAIVDIIGIGALPTTLWMLGFLILTQTPLLPRRYVFPLGMSLAFGVSKALERLPRMAGIIVAGYLLLSMGSAAVNFGRWLEPITKHDDVQSGVWLGENIENGVLAHKDLTTIWALYYGNSRTILDGFSEGVPDADQRMADVLHAFESHNLSDALDVARKYGCTALLYNDAETDGYGSDTRKFDALPLAYDTPYSHVRLLEP